MMAVFVKACFEPYFYNIKKSVKIMIDLLKVKGIKPIEKTELYYLQFTRRATATTNHLAERMARGSSSYTKGEVAGVTLDLPNAMLDALLDGQAVTIDGLGTFKPRVASQTNADPEKVTRGSIKGVDIVFAPDAKLLADLTARAEFRIVQKATAEGEKDATADEQPADQGDGQAQQPSGNGGGSGTQQPSGGGSQGSDGEFDA